MDQKAKSDAPRRESVDVDPKTELITEDDRDKLLVHLPGFAKEQLRLELTPSRTLKISGERLLADNKWLLLKREYPVSTECDTRRISARFEDGILYITQPKSALSLLVKEEKGKPGVETQKAVTEAQKPGQKPANDQTQPQKPDSEIQKANAKPAEDQPRPQKPDQKPTYDHPRPQQTADQQMKSMVDQSKQKEGMKSESVDDKGDLGREKGEEEEGKRNGEDGKGKIKEKSEGLGSFGFAGGVAPPVVGMWRRPMGKMISLVVGVFLVLVIGIFYARNWKKALPWNMENES